ncbi:CHAT domain-containing protein [Suillus subalutaceus]|uniref:CHAT domain-containing protein n=1 Tax=Suillus subalutaceus TaxID=48586 RepID=UPI001B866775|nr:CHAT domain-containing protein [Suillus subalutaceus]KAG1842525.1 CHAT domain-containing protein [Suillus subalutaceus]
MDADAARELLSKVLDVCHANSHIYRAALIAIETFALYPAESIDVNDLGQQWPAALMLAPSRDQLPNRVEQCLQEDDPHALDEVISLHYDLLGYYNTGRAFRGRLLYYLSVILRTRFDRRGNEEDLDQAIAFQVEALDLHPVGHTDRSSSLNNLAFLLSSRFEHLRQRQRLGSGYRTSEGSAGFVPGNEEDLDQAIALQMEALALHPVSHIDRSSSLNNLAMQLSSRFEHRGNDEDLDQAIALHREALALCPHRGNCKDLDQAIALHREALALCLVGHTRQSLSLDNLVNQLSFRFEHRSSGGDLDQAIALHREALALHPVGHTDWSESLNNLANQLSSRFEHRGNDKDLDQAIALYREALALHPVGHTYRSKSLNNLAGQLASRFEHRGNDEDLDQAIALHREALALHPVRHVYRPKSLNGLANQLSSRFEHRGNDKDLDQAIALYREALALCPVGHTDRSLSLNNLAGRLATRFEHRGNREDLNESRENLRCALTLLTQHDPRQSVVHHSLASVYLLFHRSGLDGTGAGKDTDSLNSAMHHLKATANVVSGGSLSRLRASLRWVHHASQHSHATELEASSVSSRHNIMKDFPGTLAVDAASCALRSGDVCHAVELLEQGRTIIWDPDDTDYTHLLTTSRHAAITQWPLRLVKEWNEAVEEIRKIEGYSRFLLPPLFSDLRDAARDGPIIMLIASKSSCDAIIIPHQQPPTSIQLPTNPGKPARLVFALQVAITKEASPKKNQPALTKALRELWDDVVHPVVEILARICTTRSHDKSLSVSFAAIGQNHPAGALFTLDSVEPELDLVLSLLPPPPTVSSTKIMSIDATKSRALCALRDNTWLHFACHGTQKFDEPVKSAFLMRDHPLSLLDIIQMDLSQHQFAFLAACETARGAFSTPDEVIHLAAGLQFAGVKSVVGTLWKVNDSTVQRLVKAFYKNLCGNSKMNPKRAALALHQAIHSLAHDKDMPLDQRIVFIHIGI